MSLALRRSPRAQITAAASDVTQPRTSDVTLGGAAPCPADAATNIRLAPASLRLPDRLAVSGNPRSVLAPLTVFSSCSQHLPDLFTLGRVAAVVTGFLIALGLPDGSGSRGWSLGLTTRSGSRWVTRCGCAEAVLEVQIERDAHLSVGSKAAANHQDTETLIGTAAGLIARVRPQQRRR